MSRRMTWLRFRLPVPSGHRRQERHGRYMTWWEDVPIYDLTPEGTKLLELRLALGVSPQQLSRMLRRTPRKVAATDIELHQFECGWAVLPAEDWALLLRMLEWLVAEKAAATPKAG